ncbi:MAG: hypothetical protein ACRKGH_08980 [Dehalogenimonas sp.]
MEIPFSRWSGAISQRVSRRSFDSQGLTPEVMASFKQFCEDFQPFSGVRAQLCVDSLDKVFKGAIGSYGKVKGA